MSFATVGSLVQTTTNTLALNPSSIGNFYLVEIETNSTSIWCTSISGGNCAWQQIGTVFSTALNPGWGSAVVFAGTATATGSASATLTFNGVQPTTRCVGQQFSTTVGGFALDGPQGNLGTNSGTNTMPSLTPSKSGDLYFCFANDTGNASAGSTSGYTYDVDAHGNGLCFNSACTSSAQAPVWNDSGEFFGIAVLLKEVSPTNSGLLMIGLP